MKFCRLKTLCLAFAALFAWNCSDSATASDDKTTPKFKVCPEAEGAGAFHLEGGMDVIIYPDYVVTNGDGVVIGNFMLTEGSVGSIIANSGKTLIQNIDLATLPIEPVNTEAIVITGPSWYLKDATGEYIIKNDEYGTVTDVRGNNVGLADIITTLPLITLYSGIDGSVITTASIDTLKVFNIGARCTTTPVESSSSVEPESSEGGEVNPGNSSSSGGNNNSSARQSSSSVKSSSSVQSSSSKTGQCPTIKTKSGGRTGSGWATRYWDCCKPHCSWPEHAGGNYSRQCTNKGKSQNSNWGDGSICSGGSQMTCTSQIPFTIDGCSEMGFAFAAVPSADGGSCGKCYQLTFTGKGKYGDNINTSSIKNKKLIIMVTNVGGDVQQGQFDIMIPGGGVGMFNGCASMGWGGQGEQYGGLLSDCERESDYKAAATQTCLKNKCNSVFSNDAEAKKGCMFLADWMHAAGNPMHNYVEVECPDVLKQKY